MEARGFREFLAGGLGSLEAREESLGWEAGRVVSGFRLVERIGHGGMGEVWIAEESNLGGRQVAIKFIRPERVSAKSLAYFEREARAGGRLSHPGLVSIFAFGEEEGSAWIAMELVEGRGTLGNVLDGLRGQSGPLSESHDLEVARFIEAVASAMEHVHGAGILHRDLKPSNIMVASNGAPRVADFGLAHIADESAITESGGAVGTLAYMSPEQIRHGAERLDPRTDVFSLGVILYEALTLSHPFKLADSEGLMRRILMEDPIPLTEARPGVPVDLQWITQKAMEKDRRRRYSSMASLADDLRRFIHHEPVEARPPSLVDRASKWSRRNPGATVAMSVGGVALGVISWLLWSNLEVKASLTESVSELTDANGKVRKSEARERRRANEVLSLSTIREVEDLHSRAHTLWPPSPERIQEMVRWDEDAAELRAALPGFMAQLESLDQRGRPLAGDERGRVLRGFDEFADLERLEGEARWRIRSEQVRSGVTPYEPVTLDSSTLPDDAYSLMRLGADYLKGDRRVFGREREGLALMELAADRARGTELEFDARRYVVLGRILVGLDDLAIAESKRLRDAAGDDLRPQAEEALAQAERMVEKARTNSAIIRRSVEAEASALRTKLERRISPLFEDDRNRWYRGELVALIEEIEGLFDLFEGVAGSGDVVEGKGWPIPARLGFARRCEAELAPDGSWRERWERASAAIHDSPRYGGLELIAHQGLVPLGEDPQSGLWEFWHPASGTEPEWTEKGGVEPTETSGLVLVLIPGGTFMMGAQASNPSDPGFHPAATPFEGPVHEVELSPFFISKYEMTQGQWWRCVGSRPSDYGPGREWALSWSAEGVGSSDLSPLTNVSWVEAQSWLERYQLRLPTEAQWEYACLAGSTAPWSSGPSPRDLEGFANLGDQFGSRLDQVPAPYAEAWLDDGWAVHAPVGSYAPNAFGLHDTHGNVGEWVFDGFLDGMEYLRNDRLDPITPPEGLPYRIVRGGDFLSKAADSRAAARPSIGAEFTYHALGIRPAMEVEE